MSTAAASEAARPDDPSARPDGPVGPDLCSYRLAHRSLLGELARLTLLAADLQDHRARLDGRGVAALADDAQALCRRLLAHLRVEDEVLWPVVTAAAGPAVDLAPLRDDHEVLRMLAGRVEDGAFGLVDLTADGLEPAEQALPPLGHALAELREALQEHIDDEERDCFPAIAAYVPAEDFAPVAAQLVDGVRPRAGA